MTDLTSSYLENTLSSFEPSVYPANFEPYERGYLTPSFGSFDPETKLFNLTPAGQRFKEYFKEQTGGLDLNILPSNPLYGDNITGHFDSHGPGGSTDPVKRNIYLNPNNQENFRTAVHEAGHAKDPFLAKEMKHFFTEAKNPTDFLNNYLAVPRHKMIAETEAQRYAIESMKALDIPYGAEQGDPYFKGYPASYIDRALAESRERLSVPQTPKALIPFGESYYRQYGKIPDNLSILEPNIPVNRVFDFADQITRKKLNLALDENYRNREQQILDNTRKYINDRLGY
jgi:hypothetical protein